jgi:hypothetical protein
MMNPDRIKAISDGAADPCDIERMVEQIVSLLTNGIKS